MVSVELLGTLQDLMSKVVRWRGTYKRRKNKIERVFGGVNLIMLADFRHLPPVTGTNLCDHSSLVPLGLACNAMKQFWESGTDAIVDLLNCTE